MEILLRGSHRRIPGLDFDENGPKIGSEHLLAKGKDGFVPRPKHDLAPLLRKTLGEKFVSEPFLNGLTTIARALNRGDIALAAIATAQLRLPTFAARPVLDLAAVLGQASPDDPVRPGWPAKTPGGRGGKFRPKNAEAALDPAAQAERAARLERLQARRGLRSMLRRVLTAKRVSRLILDGLGEAIPGLEALDPAAMIEDLSEVAAGFAEENADVDAAEAFAEHGPLTLEELSTSGEEETFSSFGAFKKIDLDKRFGSAGDGYDYHRIVEQGADFTPEQLQSTSNIVRIPKLLHEEINSIYAQSSENVGGLSLRESLEGGSFEEQRAAGLKVLQQVGALFP